MYPSSRPILHSCYRRSWPRRKATPHNRGGSAAGTAPAARRLRAPEASAHLGALLARIEDQLLHAPVQDFGDVDLVLVRTGDLVHPAELLELLAGLAEPAEHGALAVERDLVDAARISIRDERHLVLSGRDADRPRRAG